VATEEDLWELRREYSDVPSFKSILISLVVVRKGRSKFCATHEHDGWYLPAGRVDLGETFSTGATREALEEAGIPVKLEGLLRFEHTPGLRNSRFRAIYAASAADKTPLKSVPDHEIIEAKWLKIEELKKKRLRADEVVGLFSWAATGTRVFPLSILEGVDSPHISHEKVWAEIISVTDVYVKKGNLYLAQKMADGKYSVPSVIMEKPTQFKLAAAKALQPSVGVLLALDGVLKIYHVPPPELQGKGLIKVVFVAHLDSQSEAKIEGAGDNFKWLSYESFKNEPGLKRHVLKDLDLAEATPIDKLITLDFIALEMENLKTLS
jgi:8-oxo-dGTP pyrophosphatase MutT (NUDIX family)